MFRTILLASALLCLPAMAEAARLTSAPLTLMPGDGEQPHGVAEKITCSIHYSGRGTVRGAFRIGYNNSRSGGPVNSTGSQAQVTLDPLDRNFSHTEIRIGDFAIEEVVCDFNFPAVTDTNQFRALVCITNSTDTACAPVY